MEIILQQDFPALGYVGDRVKVKGGYARNFLIPRGIALEASSANEKLLKHRIGGVNAKKIKLRGQAQEMAAKIQELTVEFTLRVGAGGKTFGSITAKDVEQALHDKGVVVDKRQIILGEPLRKAGEHTVSVKLHSEVIAALKVQVSSDMPEKKAKAADESKGAEGQKPARKGRPRKAKATEEGEKSEETAEKTSSEQ